MASNDYTSPSPLHEPRDEEILRLDLMDDVHAVQSSVFLNREANIAIDGNNNGNWPDISHTYNQKEAWWQVTLPHVFPVSSIRIWNRRDGGAKIRQRLFPFFVLISNAISSISSMYDSIHFNTKLNENISIVGKICLP